MAVCACASVPQARRKLFDHEGIIILVEFGLKERRQARLGSTLRRLTHGTSTPSAFGTDHKEGQITELCATIHVVKNNNRASSCFTFPKALFPTDTVRSVDSIFVPIEQDAIACCKHGV